MLARDPLLPVHPLPPSSDLVQGVAMSTAAFICFRFFAQTPPFSVPPSSFSLEAVGGGVIVEEGNRAPVIKAIPSPRQTFSLPALVSSALAMR